MERGKLIHAAFIVFVLLIRLQFAWMYIARHYLDISHYVNGMKLNANVLRIRLFIHTSAAHLTMDALCILALHKADLFIYIYTCGNVYSCTQ